MERLIITPEGSQWGDEGRLVTFAKSLSDRLSNEPIQLFCSDVGQGLPGLNFGHSYRGEIMTGERQLANWLSVPKDSNESSLQDTYELIDDNVLLHHQQYGENYPTIVLVTPKIVADNYPTYLVKEVLGKQWEVAPLRIGSGFMFSWGGEESPSYELLMFD
jgi:hypothetical protein